MYCHCRLICFQACCGAICGAAKKAPVSPGVVLETRLKAFESLSFLGLQKAVMGMPSSGYRTTTPAEGVLEKCSLGGQSCENKFIL